MADSTHLARAGNAPATQSRAPLNIETVEVFTLDVPLADPMTFTFFGDVIRLETAHQVVVKITAGNGLAGYGQTAPVPFYHGQTQAMMVAAIRHLIPLLMGEDAFDLERLHDLMDHALRGSEPAKCAVDLALYDLQGKAVGLPVYALLGGKRRHHFQTTFTLPSGRGETLWSDEDLVAEAGSRFDEGYRAFEVHLGKAPGKGYREDVRRIEALREALGEEVELVTDLHRNWTLKEAVVGISELQRCRVYVEQPVADLDAMARLRERVGATLIADELCQTLEDGREIIVRRAADALCIKPIKTGGLFKARKLATLAETFGLLTRVDGIPGEGKLSNTASAHLVLGLRHPIVCGVMQHVRLEHDLVTEGGIELCQGSVSLAAEPGLGVSVDERLLMPAG